MFYEVENKENMIAGGNWIRQYKKTLSRVWLSIAEIREKDHPYGCVHRKLEDMPDEGRRSK